MKTDAREIHIDEVQGPDEAAQLQPKNEFMAVLTRLMDDVFVIPGTNVRFGLDPLIGLIPGFGDTTGAVISSLLLVQGARSGLPKIVIARMALNVLINTALGALPVLGDAFSVYFKSNVRNLELLKQHAGARKKSTSVDWLFVVALIAGILLVLLGSIAGLVLLLQKVAG